MSRRPKGRRAAGPATPFEASAIRHAMVIVIALKAAGLVVLFDTRALATFELPKTVFSRATEWILLGLIAMALLRYGPAVIPRTRMHLFVITLVLVAALSALFAENTYVALYGERGRYLGLFFTIDVAVLYLAVAVAMKTVRDWLLVGAALTIAAALAVAYGLIQYLGLDPIRWRDDPRDRPFSTFGNPDPFSHFLVVAFAASAAVALMAKSRVLRAFAAAVAAGTFAAALAAEARSTLVGLGAVALMGGAIGQRLLPAARRRMAVAAAIPAVLVVMLIVSISPIGRRASTAINAGFRDEPRLVVYRIALTAFAERPLLGYGPDGYGVAFPGQRLPTDAVTLRREPENNAHSWLLQAAVTTGILGVGAVVGSLAAFLAMLWRLARGSAQRIAVPLLLASAAYWGYGIFSVGSISVDWFPGLAFGGAVALGRPAGVVMPVRRIWGFANLGIMAAAVVAGLAGVQSLHASEEAKAARNDIGRGAITATVHAKAAVTADPGRADHWNYLGLSMDLTKAWKDSGDAFLQAATRAPYEATYWSNLARSRTKQALAGDERSGGAAAALTAARRAVAVDPYDPGANAVLAEVLWAFGQYDEALRSAVRAIELYPAEPSFDPIARRAAQGVKDLEGARALIARALGLKDTAVLHVAAAETAMKLSDRASARRHATRALELDPGNEDAARVLKALDTRRPASWGGPLDAGGWDGREI